jgi:hypothetical protein
MVNVNWNRWKKGYFYDRIEKKGWSW